MTETTRAWGALTWTAFVISLLLASGAVLVVATLVAFAFGGTCSPPASDQVHQGLVWLSVVLVVAALPWSVVAARSTTSARWVVGALVCAAPALLVLLAYADDPARFDFCIPF